MNQKRIYIAIIIITILLVPYLTRMPWTASDYVVAAVLLCGTGFMFELVTNNISSSKKKLVAGGAVLLVAIYIWAELAVGIFTSLGS